MLQQDPASGRIVGQVRQGGGSELRLAEFETANDNTRMRMKNEDQDEDKDGDDDGNDDDDAGAGGKGTKMTDGACLERGGEVDRQSYAKGPRNQPRN